MVSPYQPYVSPVVNTVHFLLFCALWTRSTLWASRERSALPLCPRRQRDTVPHLEPSLTNLRGLALRALAHVRYLPGVLGSRVRALPLAAFSSVIFSLRLITHKQSFHGEGISLRGEVVWQKPHVTSLALVTCHVPPWKGVHPAGPGEEMQSVS